MDAEIHSTSEGTGAEKCSFNLHLEALAYELADRVNLFLIAGRQFTSERRELPQLPHSREANEDRISGRP